MKYSIIDYVCCGRGETEYGVGTKGPARGGKKGHTHIKS